MAEDQTIKLDRFASSVEADVLEQVKQLEKNTEEKCSELLKNSREKATREANEKIAKARTLAEAKYRRSCALEEQELRSDYLLKRQQLKEQIFENVRKKLDDFTKSPEYEKYIINGLSKEKLENAVVHISERDRKFTEKLEERFKTKVITDKSITLGGYLIEYIGSNAEIDSTFDSSLTEQAEGFSSHYSFEKEESPNG